MTRRIDVGSLVRLKRRVAPGYRISTVVVGWIPGIEGGVVLKDQLAGFRGWNVEDLEPYRTLTQRRKADRLARKARQARRESPGAMRRPR